MSLILNIIDKTNHYGDNFGDSDARYNNLTELSYLMRNSLDQYQAMIQTVAGNIDQSITSGWEAVHEVYEMYGPLTFTPEQISAIVSEFKSSR